MDYYNKKRIVTTFCLETIISNKRMRKAELEFITHVKYGMSAKKIIRMLVEANQVNEQGEFLVAP